MIRRNEEYDASQEEEPESEVVERARRILEIVPGERRLLPEFGCRIHEMRSLATEAARQLAAALIEESLETWAPDLGVDRTEVAGTADQAIRVRMRADGVWRSFWVAHRHTSRGEIHGP